MTCAPWSRRSGHWSEKRLPASQFHHDPPPPHEAGEMRRLQENPHPQVHREKTTQRTRRMNPLMTCISAGGCFCTCKECRGWHAVHCWEHGNRCHMGCWVKKLAVVPFPDSPAGPDPQAGGDVRPADQLAPVDAGLGKVLALAGASAVGAPGLSHFVSFPAGSSRSTGRQGFVRGYPSRRRGSVSSSPFLMQLLVASAAEQSQVCLRVPPA